MTFWNYIALAAAVLAALFALVSLLRLLAVYVGGKVWTGRGGMQLNVLYVAVNVPLAVWLASLTGLVA